MELREKKIIKTSIIGILVNILLVAFKAFVGVLAKSTAVIMDALNNFADALSSLVTIVGTKLAHKKPDKKHPYGYGNLEHLTSIVVAVIVLVAGISASVESFNKIIHPEETDYKWYSFVIIVGAIIGKLLLGLYTRHQGKKYNSDALKASGTDAFLDSLVSISTLIGAILMISFHWNVEGYLGILIACLIVKSGVEILIDSIGEIIGKRIPREISVGVKRTINEFDEVHGAYDLLLNRYGPEKIVGSVHIEVDDDMKATEIHKLSQNIALKIYQDFGIVLTVGIYATNNNNPFYLEIKSFVRDIIKDNKDVLQMHGFFFDLENKYISFDLVISFDAKDSNAIIEEVKNKCKERYPLYQFVINTDTDISD